MADLISIRDVDTKWILSLFASVSRMEELAHKGSRALAGKIVGTLFFEPSTRTRLSFQTAAARLGASVLNFGSIEASSLAKGESLSDTIRTIDGYVDAIVIRHSLEGTARLAAQLAQHPVINAGDGGNQHPTQTLIDLYTINKLKHKIKGVNVHLVGDLKYARAMHSLVYGLAMFKANITLVSPPALEMDAKALSEIEDEFGVKMEKRNSLDASDCDVLYVCRIQKERFADQYEAAKLQKEFQITAESLKGARNDMVILHPLPKLDEIAQEVAESEKVRYFEQAAYGVPVRMAVLERLMKK